MLQPDLTVATAELTPAEIRVLKYLVQGLSNLDIAVEARVCRRTVQAQVSSMLSKTEFSNRTALALWAIRQPEISTQTSN